MNPTWTPKTIKLTKPTIAVRSQNNLLFHIRLLFVVQLIGTCNTYHFMYQPSRPAASGEPMSVAVCDCAASAHGCSMLGVPKDPCLWYRLAPPPLPFNLRNPKYHQIQTIAPLIKVHSGVCRLMVYRYRHRSRSYDMIPVTQITFTFLVSTTLLRGPSKVPLKARARIIQQHGAFLSGSHELVSSDRREPVT